MYDIIVVGGGLGGATLAKAMAEHGARVLVLERERRFKDRVRGEATWPWGVAELKPLGVYQVLIVTCACEVSGSIPTSEASVSNVEICRLLRASKLLP